MPNISFDNYRSFRSIKNAFEERYENHLNNKEPMLSNKAFIKREINRVLDGLKQYKNIPQIKNVLDSYLPWLEDQLEKEMLNKKSDNQSAPKNTLLSWNGDTHLLTHMFYIMRTTLNKDGDKLIPNTVEEIARFLKENFAVYKTTKISTIETQLTKANKQPKKTKVLFQINPR